MSPELAELIAQLLWWTGFFAFVVAAGCTLVNVVFSAFIDWAWPPSAEEISRRDAEKRAKQATRDFKRRQRLRVPRFWSRP